MASDDRIKGALLEYLRYHAMTNTLECFEVESQQKLTAAPVSPRSGANTEGMRFRLRRDMMRAFDEGEQERFMTMWAKHVPQNVRDNDPPALRLEFYLQLHFAVIPFRTSYLRKMAKQGNSRAVAARAAEGMLAFRKFLENRGQALSQEAEFLPYYALPYVPNPSNHPSFKPLFADKWVTGARHRLERFLDVILQSVSLPELYQMFGGSAAANGGQAGSVGISRSDSSSSLAGQVSGEALQQFAARETQLRDAFFAQQEKYKDFARSVYSVSLELFNALERVQAGQAVSDKFMEYVKKRLDMFEGVLSSAGFGQQKAAPAKKPMKHLDYPLLCTDLSRLVDSIGTASEGKAPRECSLILQALRWRLSRARPRNLKKAVLAEMIDGDLLGCIAAERRGEESTLGSLLGKLLKCKLLIVVEYTCRLINEMASISAGRTYLLQHPAAVDHLVSVLREQDSDTIARQNALGTLQKFSLRHKPQTAMIKLDLVKWIASILRAHCRAEADGETEAKGGNGILTEYTVEYATALLMNLSVRTIGKIKAEDEEVGILEVMNELLESENTQVRTYVNGTLYSVLTRPVLKERALEMGMDEMLKSLMEHSPEEFKNQIVFILDQLLKEDDATEEASDGEDVADDDVDDDEDEDDEEEEEEDDAEESLTPPEAGSKEASGQQLLEAQYASAEKTGFLGGSSPSHGRSPPAGSAAVAGQYQRPPVGHEQQGHAGAAAAKTGDPYESKIEDVDSGNMEARQDQDASAEEGGSTAMLDRTMKKRNENLAEELMSRPRIPRTPQTDSLGIMDPGEFGKAQANMGQSDPRAQAASGVSGEGLRYHKPVDDGYSKAFGDRPNLVRTPLVSASDLVAEPNEFGHYAGSKSEY